MIVTLLMHSNNTQMSRIPEDQKQITNKMMILQKGTTIILDIPVSPAWQSLCSRTSMRPLAARGAGSSPRRENLSAREAKQRRAPSLTKWSSWSSRADRWLTQSCWALSLGSILPHRRETTVIQECRVSLCTWLPCSQMKVRTQFRPPASNTAPDSRVHTSSNTWSTKILFRWFSYKIFFLFFSNIVCLFQTHFTDKEDNNIQRIMLK